MLARPVARKIENVDAVITAAFVMTKFLRAMFVIALSAIRKLEKKTNRAGKPSNFQKPRPKSRRRYENKKCRMISNGWGTRIRT